MIRIAGFLSGFLFITSFIFGMGSRPLDIPMKASKIKFEDGEYVRMGAFSGGEKKQEWHIVARVDKTANRAEIYWQQLDIASGQVVPQNYRDFNTYRYTIDLSTGCELSSVYNNPITNDKSVIRSSFNFDPASSEIRAEAESWDGYEMKKIRSKIAVRKGFPVFDPGALFYIVRFLDITGPGIVYQCEPRFLKEPMPVSFKTVGRETVVTPAGKFQTIKVTFNLADPFLAKLVQPFTKGAYIWLEDSPRLLVVKVAGLGTDYYLEEVSDIRQKGWK